MLPQKHYPPELSFLYLLLCCVCACLIPLKFQAHLKSSISFYLSLNVSHDNFVLSKQYIEELLWRRILHWRDATIMSKTINGKWRTKGRSKIKTSVNSKVLWQQHCSLPETFRSLLLGVSKTNILCFLPAQKLASLMVGQDLGQQNKIQKWYFLKVLPLSHLHWTDDLGLSHYKREDRIPRFF